MFAYHPVNLAFRFLLEVGAMILIGVGASTLGSGASGAVLGIGFVSVAALTWGVFNVPGDESRSGKAPVPVRGYVRLAIEVAVFAWAVILGSFAWPVVAFAFGAAVTVHYLVSLDRVRWLLER